MLNNIVSAGVIKAVYLKRGWSFVHPVAVTILMLLTPCGNFSVELHRIKIPLGKFYL